MHARYRYRQSQVSRSDDIYAVAATPLSHLVVPRDISSIHRGESASPLFNMALSANESAFLGFGFELILYGGSSYT
jgi:hypothetical protein